MSSYHVLLLCKFIGVMLYAGGFAGAFITGQFEDRKRAVHGIASPGLMITWLAGYGLTRVLGIPLGSFWIVGGFILSLVSLLALIYSVSNPVRTKGSFLAALIPLSMVLILMVFRPLSWKDLP